MRLHRTHRHGRTPARSLTPLLMPAGIAGSLGIILAFLAAALFVLGAYLLIEGINHPLRADATETIGAAVLIALALTMLLGLFQLRGNANSRRHRHKFEGRSARQAAISSAVIEIPATKLQTELPFGSSLADRSGAAD